MDGCQDVLVLVVFPDHGMFMFVNSLMKVAASVTQITFEFVYYTLLVYQGWFFFRNSQMISDLFRFVARSY